MIENNNTVNKDLEKALQARQRVVNEKKSRTRRYAKPRTTTSTSWVAFML